MRFSRRALSVLTVTLVLLVLGGGVYRRLRPAAAKGARTQTPPGAEARSGDGAAQVSSVVGGAFSTDVPQPVSGANVIRDTLWISVTAAGRAESVSRATLQAQVAGVVEAVSVRENAAVEAGDLLLRIDSTEYALALARAESDLRKARADYRQTVLFDDRITDARVKAQRDSIARSRSGLDAAEVAVQTRRLELDRSRVGSPFPGRIADVRVVAGQHVNVGAELMTVVSLDPIKVEANVLEAEMGLLAEGRRATVRFAAFPGETFTGRIQTVNPVIDPEKRSGRVTVALDNPGGRIKPGMYAEVALAATSFPDRLLVPRAAILERGDGRRRTMLFVYQEEAGVGRAKWRYVTTGRENDSLVEIVPSEEGTVEPGDVVLVDGHHYLAHDTPVRLVDDVEKAGGRPGR